MSSCHLLVFHRFQDFPIRSLGIFARDTAVVFIIRRRMVRGIEKVARNFYLPQSLASKKDARSWTVPPSCFHPPCLCLPVSSQLRNQMCPPHCLSHISSVLVHSPSERNFARRRCARPSQCSNMTAGLSRSWTRTLATISGGTKLKRGGQSSTVQKLKNSGLKSVEKMSKKTVCETMKIHAADKRLHFAC